MMGVLLKVRTEENFRAMNHDLMVDLVLALSNIKNRIQKESAGCVWIDYKSLARPSFRVMIKDRILVEIPASLSDEGQILYVHCSFCWQEIVKEEIDYFCQKWRLTSRFV